MRSLSYLFAVRDLLVTIIFCSRSFFLIFLGTIISEITGLEAVCKTSTRLFISNTLFQIRLSAASPFGSTSQIRPLISIVP